MIALIPVKLLPGQRKENTQFYVAGFLTTFADADDHYTFD